MQDYISTYTITHDELCALSDLVDAFPATFPITVNDSYTGPHMVTGQCSGFTVKDERMVGRCIFNIGEQIVVTTVPIEDIKRI